MAGEIYHQIIETKSRRKKSLAILIDPDKTGINEVPKLVELFQENKPEIILVGGSLITSNHLDELVAELKAKTHLPVVLFPGNSLHISPKADGILFLSLISGRNPEFLIGQHVNAAPILKKAGIEVIPTGYMLIDCGVATTANYMSNTTPIPFHKPEIAVCTAMAGEMLGMRMIYMDGGSGADKPISLEMVKKVKENLGIPLIIGGGIRNGTMAKNAYEAGADMIVVGTAVEKNRDLLQEICEAKNSFN
ncbi:geranylgeranylglyceryl/heptaprenylglyceryl phosphate synthase [Flexithrix dorotheae]|uniref:geranylgeranylglyceryl/heptaprenylglyceryl phosphate synthase n=1 Tax=Flexithrix dorotheae TaxID=70993 RepID=UPI000381883C|nr:geranylgeranylglyceryl/heptaprenylglyceryl phosphate synthase [Flexithrix dorotheae]